MKITSITARICNAEMRNWIFVRVETDQPGLIGWCEATRGYFSVGFVRTFGCRMLSTGLSTGSYISGNGPSFGT